MQLDMKILHEFVDIENSLATIGEKEAGLKERKEVLGAMIEEMFISTGIGKMSVNGRTVFPKPRIYAKVSSRQEAGEALKNAGYEHMVKEGYNGNSLNSLLSELDKSDEGLPPEFEGVIEINKVTKIQTRKS